MIKQKVTLVEKKLINIKVLKKLISFILLSKSEGFQMDNVGIISEKKDVLDIEDVYSYIKPIINREIFLTLNKFIDKIEAQNQLIPVSTKTNFEYKEYVAIPSLDKIDFIKMADIIYCKSDGRYTRFVLACGKTLISSRNLGEYEYRILDTNHFFRIHHSYIINMRYLIKINKKDGNYCELTNGEFIPIAKRRLDEFNKFIQLKI